MVILLPSKVFADQPRDWQLGFQDAASQSMYEIVSFHNSILLPIIIAISVFVLFLMAYACFRFRESRILILLKQPIMLLLKFFGL